MKIVVRLAAMGIAALALTAQAAVLTPADNPFASIGAQWSMDSSPAFTATTDVESQTITMADSLAPEPATLGLIGAGLTALGLLRRGSTRKR